MRSGICFLAVLFVVLSASTFAYDWSTNPGDGSASNPYQISEPNQLTAIGSNAALLDKHFILMNDIVFDPTNNPAHVFDNAIIAPDTDNSTNIFNGTKFMGYFDGQNYSIYNFKCIDSAGNYIGLFGYIEAGVIKNLRIENAIIYGSEFVGCLTGFNYGVISNVYCSGVVSGYEEVGGIIGTSYNGCIKDCVSDVFVSLTSWFGGGICGYVCDTPILNCKATGDISGDGDIGGLVGGSRWSYIINCSATGNVTGYERIGGLAGWLDWYLIRSCYASGNVEANRDAGGLVGENTGILENSYASGNVYVSTGGGGLIGADWSGDGHVLNCMSTGFVTGTSQLGGLVGTTDGDTLYLGGNFFDADKNPDLPGIGNTSEPNIIGKTTTELCDEQTFIASDWDFVDETQNGTDDFWTMPDSEGYPVLRFQVMPESPLPIFSGGDGAVDNPFLIASTTQFNQIGNDYRLIDKHFKLINDLDFDGLEFKPIGSYDLPFTGSFDGNKKRLLNIELNIEVEDVDIGVFSSCDCGAKVFDLGVENLSVKNDPGKDIGGIVSNGYGVIIQRCYVTGSGLNGFIAENLYYGRIENCYALGHISNSGAGGIAYSLRGTSLINCYASVLVDNAAKAGNIFAYGSVNAQNCFYDQTINGILKAMGFETFSGIEPLNQSEMSNPSIFIRRGWDFVDEAANGTEDIWRNGLRGPVFSWQNNTVVPNVMGMDMINAENSLHLSGLNIIIKKEVYSQTIPAGQVFEQNPVSGSVCIESFPVSVLVSKGPCPYSGGSGTADNPCRIANAADLVLLANTADDYALNFILVSNINLAQQSFNGGLFTALGTTMPAFTGCFDGNNHTISNFKINVDTGSYKVSHGLFRSVRCKGEIKNLNVNNFAFVGNNYQMACGGIAGEMSLGVINNCRVNGPITMSGVDFAGIIDKNSSGIITNCYSEFTLNANYTLAGIALENLGIISRCAAKVNLTTGGTVAGLVKMNFSSGTIENCYAHGSLKGYGYGGGLAAYNYADNRVCNCFAACMLTGYFYSNGAGGLVGYEGSNPLTYPGCVWDKTWYTGTGTGRNSTSVLGATITEMKQIGTFTGRGWDFLGENTNGQNDIWRMCADGVEYPRLNWEFAKGGDFSCPNGIAMDDLLRLCQDWLQTYEQALYGADADGDSVVSFKDFGILAGNWLEVPTSSSTEITDGFETGDFFALPWSLTGNQNWTIVTTGIYEGTKSAKSGGITHSQTSTMELTVNSGDLSTISFARKVSSQTNYDYLRFYIDGVEKNKWSGTVDWSIVSFSFTPGPHTFKWSYTKNSSISSGSDCAWIDAVRIYKP